jgi:hypothetical protein
MVLDVGFVANQQGMGFVDVLLAGKLPQLHRLAGRVPRTGRSRRAPWWQATEVTMAPATESPAINTSVPRATRSWERR